MDDPEYLFMFINTFSTSIQNINGEISAITINNLSLVSAFTRYVQTKRRHVPKVTGFAENGCTQFSLSDFRSHFRISKPMFDEILMIIQDDLSREYTGGMEPIQPSKSLLIFLCYLANMQSHREIGLHFGVCKATVFNVVNDVSTVFLRRLSKVICNQHSFNSNFN